jgi:hypothetical protein
MFRGTLNRRLRSLVLTAKFQNGNRRPFYRYLLNRFTFGIESFRRVYYRFLGSIGQTTLAYLHRFNFLPVEVVKLAAVGEAKPWLGHPPLSRATDQNANLQRRYADQFPILQDV